MSRPFDEIRAIMLDKAKNVRNPFYFTEFGVVEPILKGLNSTEPEAWAQAFAAAAEPHEAQAREAETAGDFESARQQYVHAYAYYHVARYPTANSPEKWKAYLRGRDAFMNAGRYMTPSVERVSIPFEGRSGEGHSIPGLFRRPPSNGLSPLVITWSGIESFKEDRITDNYTNAGIASLAIDMPGTGEAPIPGSEDAERLWDAVFEWVRNRPDLDAGRVGIWGAGTGAYWAVKLAHTHAEHLTGVVNHGGGVHMAFDRDWLMKAEQGEYPFEFCESFARSFGLETREEWLDYAPRLSLLTQGLLDQPCAPMLCTGGTADTITPIADQYLLLEHGNPKTARFYEGAGHLGTFPDVNLLNFRWLSSLLLAPKT